jgi:hypothetical protein
MQVLQPTFSDAKPRLSYLRRARSPSHGSVVVKLCEQALASVSGRLNIGDESASIKLLYSGHVAYFT